MPNDGQPIDAEQGRTTELRIVDALGEALENKIESVLRPGKLRVGFRHAVQQVKDHLGHAFAAFDQNVAPKAVAHDHVDRVFKHVFAFHVAGKV